MIDNCVIILFGATGDLSARKLLPAIYNLVSERKITNFAIIGVALAQIDKEALYDRLKADLGRRLDKKVLDLLISRTRYIAGDFHDCEIYKTLSREIIITEQQYQIFETRLFYFATMPEHFSVITDYLSRHNMVTPQSRVVYEKPFGRDEKSAELIKLSIEKVFTEPQVFCIDHYLGKELVANITTMRFANQLFKAMWDNKSIKSVQIILHESEGIGTRGHYYDTAGALRDMIQNHALQLLSLIAMEEPVNQESEAIHAAKAAVLSATRIEDALLGQYDGYLREPSIAPNSQTETFAALKLTVSTPRWEGVPFYIKTGKKLYERAAAIVLEFHDTNHHNFIGSEKNSLVITIEPEEGFSFIVNTTAPGESKTVFPLTLTYRHGAIIGGNTPKAYEKLLYDVMRGDHGAFVSFEEIALSWKIIDPVLTVRGMPERYPGQSRGPAGVDTFEKRHDMRWAR